MAGNYGKADTTLPRIFAFQKSLEIATRPETKLQCFKLLDRIEMTEELLRVTGIGRTIQSLALADDLVGEAAFDLVHKWRCIITEKYIQQQRLRDVEEDDKEEVKKKDKEEVMEEDHKEEEEEDEDEQLQDFEAPAPKKPAVSRRPSPSEAGPFQRCPTKPRLVTSRPASQKSTKETYPPKPIIKTKSQLIPSRSALQKPRQEICRPKPINVNKPQRKAQPKKPAPLMAKFLRKMNIKR